MNYLNMDLETFRMICTLSCNDYVNNDARKHFIYFINLLGKFMRYNNLWEIALASDNEQKLNEYFLK